MLKTVFLYGVRYSLWVLTAALTVSGIFILYVAQHLLDGRIASSVALDVFAWVCVFFAFFGTLALCGWVFKLLEHVERAIARSRYSV